MLTSGATVEGHIFPVLCCAWLTERVGLARGTTQRRNRVGGDRSRAQSEGQTKQNTVTEGPRETGRGWNCRADTPQLHDWPPMLDLVLILGVILGPSSLLPPVIEMLQIKQKVRDMMVGQLLLAAKKSSLYWG